MQAFFSRMRLAEPNKLHRKSGFEQALSLYDLPPDATVHLISRSENETYKVEAPSGRRWALRVQRPGYQSKNALASEIAWLVALRKDGVVATPVPIAGLNGEWVQVARIPVREPRALLKRATWFSLPGKTATNPPSVWICANVLGAWAPSPRRCMRTAPHGSGPKVLNDLPGTLKPPWGSLRDGAVGAMGWAWTPTKLDLFGRTVELIRDRLASYGSGPDRFGLAHCDLRLANLLVHEGESK
jgi:hypothetical protein